MQMLKKYITIHNRDINIPAVVWGENTGNLYIAVHGSMSNKEDDVIAVFAEAAVEKGYQVLSFDLPEHGDRSNENYPCKPDTCISDLAAVYWYARLIADHISFFGCSMGVYFGLLAYADMQIDKSLFLSPLVDMGRFIDCLMTSFQIPEKTLEEEREIMLPVGVTLYWDYYCYVKTHPIGFWNFPTRILCGEKDDLIPLDELSDFAEKNAAVLDVAKGGEHYFHTEEQLESFRNWLRKSIDCIK